MRIGINARYIQNPLTGIETSLLKLLINLRKIDRDNEYFLFFGDDKPAPNFARRANFRHDISKMPTGNQVLKILWTHFYLPAAIVKNKIDVFHEPTFVAPIFKKCPTVVTIYDTAFLYLPSSYPKRNIIYFKALLSGAIKRADAIIAISENTKKDILGNFKASAGKIHVVHLGCDDTYHILRDRERIDQVKGLYNIKNDFILNVSLISPRKNIIGLIRAFKILKQSKKTELSLVIAGRNGWLYEEVFREVRSSGLERDVIFTGYIPEEHLLCLYNSARAFVFPSLYEGFGLPVLEAMACACPIVSSNASSMPEVCGDAAIMVDPRNTGELADAINDILDDSSRRRLLIEKGLERVKRFSWEKTAVQTLSVYNKIYEFGKGQDKRNS